VSDDLKQALFEEARRLGFVLAGVTTPDPSPHMAFFERWLDQGYHGEMAYLASERSRRCRADPQVILPECQSILVLAIPYSPPPTPSDGLSGRVAAYALGEDYHEELLPRLARLVAFLEQRLGHPVPHRYYTDTGPILERDLAQRAGLGWIGKNTCLIHPRHGSYLLLAEILLGLALEPDPPFPTDHCGTCTRCIEACPTDAILPGRVLDARRCISYLTIENKGEIPEALRPQMGNWIFGCDICQIVCPWNRFAAPQGDAAFRPFDASGLPRAGSAVSDLIAALALSPDDFRQRFRRSPVRRAKRSGLLRNVSVALGNLGDPRALPALERAASDPDPLVRQHAEWARQRLLDLSPQSFPPSSSPSPADDDHPASSLQQPG